jgi:glycosyltransferase involved in cell wall biosynthesis
VTIEVSIIIPTLARLNEVVSCLESIKKSDFKNIEILIVDQNCSNLLEPTIKSFEEQKKIIHTKVNFKGVSKARNHAAKMAVGKYLFFLDDDAELFPETISLALSIIKNKEVDVIFGRCVDRFGVNVMINFKNVPGFLSLSKHKNMFIESTMMIKRNIFLDYLFDEGLGVGTFHGAHEGYDIVLRMLYNNISIFYDPSIKVYHPHKKNYYNDYNVRRVFAYSCGFAKLCQKHGLHKMYFKRLILVILYLPYLFVFQKNKYRYYVVEMNALIVGRFIN